MKDMVKLKLNEEVFKFFFCILSINETKNTPLYNSLIADSSSFVILDKNKFSGEGFEIKKGKKILLLLDYRMFIMRKFEIMENI